MTRLLARPVALRCLLLLSLSAALPAQQSTYRPGTLDPAGNSRNLTLFRDEQIYSVGLPSATGGPWRAATLSFDASVTPTSTVAPVPWMTNVISQDLNIRAAAGHILNPDKQSIFLVQRATDNSTTLVGHFSDNSGSTNIATIPNREPGYADFFSVASGDVDGLVDANGNYHDEVVAAWTENEPGSCKNNVVPHLAVLNYNDNDPSNPTITSVRVDRADGAYYNTCQLEGYYYLVGGNASAVPANIPQPNDTIIATAIGDFDGDGQNEIALAYLRPIGNFAGITIVTYRYLNDGANASLTQLNSYDLSMPNSAGVYNSLVATVSLSAGNFNGSGVDQLVVATSEWRGTLQSDGQFTRGTFRNQPVVFLMSAGSTTTPITSAVSSGTNNETTDFTVSLSPGGYIPRAVTISGATGAWSQINGTWPVTPNGTGFTLDLDTSGLGCFNGPGCSPSQTNVTVSEAAPLQQTAFAPLEPIPGSSSGGIQVDDTDSDGFIRVQTIPGLFHFDPASGFDYRRRQVAMVWNSRPAPSSGSDAQDADTHLALIQITDTNQIQVAYTGSNVAGNFQLFQSFNLTAGALRGDNNTNDPTWSLYFTGVGIDFINGNVARGMVAAVWNVTPDPKTAANLVPQFVCSEKVNANANLVDYAGVVDPRCPIWVDAETASWPLRNIGTNPNYLRLPSIAADLKGNSIRLGAPIHAQVFNPAKTNYVLEQPPQHSAWLDTGDGKGPHVLTVNRYLNFSTDLQDSSGQDLTTSDTDHLDWNIGGSIAASASTTDSLGPDGDQLSANVSLSGSISTKVSYDRDTQSKNYNSSYKAQTVGSGASTQADDYLDTSGQLYDIWRYRLYGSGTATGNPSAPNAFYEIVLPGPSLESKGGGLHTDWYQPIHEIGNILSYPDFNAVCGSDGKSPADLGPITLPTNPPSTVSQPYISCQQIFYDGTFAKLSLALETKTANGTTTDYTNKLHADLDFSTTFQSKFVVEGSGTKTKLSSDVDVHGGGDWGHMHVGDGSTSNATNIQITSPGVDNSHSYPYYPILYNTDEGGLKTAFAVGSLSLNGNNSASPFWTDVYGQKPDPALNLPFRFTPFYERNVQTDWTPETTILRKRMKGVVLRSATLDPQTNDYPLLGRNPGEGETVLLDIRVYNYSLSTNPTAPFQVKIYTIPYDSGTDNEICPGIPTTGFGGRVCPASFRTFAGVASTEATGGQQNFVLTARQHQQAYFLWKIQNMNSSSTGTTDYRVYVVLDSGNNPGVELYPAEPPCTGFPCEDNAGNEGAAGTFSTLDPGQNNEGWTLLSVGPRPPTLLGARQQDGASSITEASLTGVSRTSNLRQPVAAPLRASAETNGKGKKCKPSDKPLTAYLHQMMPLRITTFGNADSRLWGQAVVYDLGSRKKAVTLRSLRNATAIAGKYVPGTRTQGSSVWFDWTPHTTGLHHLYVTIQNTDGATPAGELFVVVRRAPGDFNGDGRIDGHDLNILRRDQGKKVAAAACGSDCDLDGDGLITAKDLALLSQACDTADCSFHSVTYEGGITPDEPDMRLVRAAEKASLASYRAEAAVENDATSLSEPELFRAESQRRQSLRSTRYFYRGKPVTKGAFAQGRAANARP